MLSVHTHDHGIMELRLERAEFNNAFNCQMVKTLRQTLSELADNAACQVLLLSAEGKHFCAGADLTWMQTMVNNTYEENLLDAMNLAKLMQQLYNFPVPTIALVQGYAFGGGLGLIACCDMAYALPQAKFCFSEVSLGLTPATISPYVIAAIGERAARRYFLTAEIFTAEKARELSLITEIVHEGNLFTDAFTTAKTLCGNGQAAIRAAKELIRTVSRTPITEELITYTAHSIADRRVSSEAQERMAAFLCSKKS